MLRQQFFIIASLVITCATPTFAGNYDNQGGNQGSGWKAATASDEPSGTTMNGRLYRNSADQNGVAPYVLLDRFGVVKGYVAASSAVELEPYVGKQVSLQGSAKALPGGDMSCLTVNRILGGDGKKAASTARQQTAPARVRTVAATSDRDYDVAPDPTPPRRINNNQPRPQQRPRPSGYDDSNPMPAPAPRNTRIARSQAASYQEPIPTTKGIQPVPMAETRPMVESMPAPQSGPFIESPEMAGPMEDGSSPSMEQGMHHFRHGTPIYDDGDCGCDVCGPCASCDNGDCDGLPPHGRLFSIGPTGLWVQADFLLWSERGMNVPPLVTSGPDAANPGILGEPGTTVLFGGNEINDRTRAGGRLQAGIWMNACQTVGLEGEYVGLADQNTNFYDWSPGSPIISRPFILIAPDNGQVRVGQDAENVALPNVSAGSVAVDAKTSFSSETARFVFALCKCEGCWSDCCCNSYHDSYNSYLMVGYRHMDLNDTLGIQENLTDNNFDSFSVHDEFDTQNSFDGGEIAMKFEFQRNRWWFDIMPKIALGNTHEVVNISGATQITMNGVSTVSQGGLLAQQTNIGSYSRNVFAVVPEIDLNVGYQITPHARLEAGYTFLYWSNVVRAGDQIDPEVNGAYIAGSGQPLVGDTTRPHFAFEQSSYWAQGVNLGLKLTW